MAISALTVLGAAGLTALDIFAPGAPSRNIGGIVAQVTVDETGVDQLTITDHPVERDANISDHAYLEAPSVTIRVGWSNSSLSALGGTVNAALDAQGLGDALAAFTSPDYVSGIYSQLLTLQASRQPFTIVTGKRTYQNMLIRSISQTTDAETSNSLIATIVCRAILLVTTQTTTVPSQSVQANPQSTASPAAIGPVQPTPATPSNRGAFAPNPAQPAFQIPLGPPPPSLSLITPATNPFVQ